MFKARANFSLYAGLTQTCPTSILLLCVRAFCNKPIPETKNRWPVDRMDIGSQGMSFKVFQAVIAVDTRYS
jgi:hypothetical protein